MKNLSILFFIIFLSFSISAQNLSEKIAIKACECISAVNTIDSLQSRMDQCIPESMALVMKEGSEQEVKELTTVTGIKEHIKKVYEQLPTVCPPVRKLLIEQKKENFYRMSESASANESFEKGNELMRGKNYKGAIKHFQKAIKLDQQFIYALDHLAVCYRQLGEYDKAIKQYEKSMQIFPEGDLALLNMAVIYSLKNDLKTSLQYYEQLQYYYPDYAEGYFGIAKLSFLQADYEKALDNIFVAHRMYIQEDSPYSKDSEKLISVIYQKLIEIGKEDLFLSKAKEYNINLSDK